MQEQKLIDWIGRQSKFQTKAVPVGPGDDCAVVRLGGESLAVTTDQVLDGVHFDLTQHSPRAAGRKAMARSLSDLAAMAAKPVGAVATVAFPKGFPSRHAKAIYKGLRQLGDTFGCPVVGGDVGAWAGALCITVTAFGRHGGKGRKKFLLRSGARPGQAVCVTGSLGGAWRSRRHLNFTPRIVEALALAARYCPTAMIDISDGLARDLGHICRASHVGAEIHPEQIPVHPDMRRAGKGKAAAYQAALCDGEDYELLFTLSARSARKLLQDQPLPIPVTCIGKIAAGKGITLVHPNGRRKRLAATGWEHRT